MSRSASLIAAAAIWVDHVAQALAEKGEAEGGDNDRQTAGDHQPRRLADQRIAIFQERAPGGRRRLHPHAEEGEARLERDDVGNVHRRQHGQHADDVGNHVLEQVPRDRGAHRPLGHDELGSAEAQRLGARHPPIGRDRGRHDHEHHRLERGPTSARTASANITVGNDRIVSNRSEISASSHFGP